MTAARAKPGDGNTGLLSQLQAAFCEVPVLIHSPPDINRNTEIMGVCGLSEHLSGTNKYAWIAVDFLRWKTLLYGNWFSSLDMEKFHQDVGFGDNSPDSSHAIFGKNKDHIASIPANNEGFIASFLKHLAARAKAANERNTTLLLVVFAPVTPENDIVVDFDCRPEISASNPKKNFKFLTVDRIREAIRDAVGHDELPVILMTESPLTGGWVCHPSLFGTSRSHPDDSLQLIARSCGGVFADEFVNSFTKRSTPLLTDEQRSAIPYDDMTPIGATLRQTKILHGFQRAIHESLEFRLSPLGKRHSMIFTDPRTDTWSIFGPREGYPLVDFWGTRLAPDDVKIDGLDRFDFLGEAFGGSRESQVFHLKYLVSVEISTCPGDWTRGMTGITASMLLEFLNNPKPDVEAVKRVFDTLEFRGSSITLAQILLKALGLPIPEEKCRYWTDKVGDDMISYTKLQAGFANVHNLLAKPAILPGENRHTYKHVRFYRPSRWISAALALIFADRPDKEIHAFITNNIAPLIEVIRQKQQELLLEDQALIAKGKEWISSLNL
ncbi:hypothetical protein B0T16DRAFT_316306, partial [Cercophora newfieldiana]